MFENVEVLLELLLRGSADDDGIALFCLQIRMPRRPPQRRSVAGDAVEGGVALDHLGGGEEGVVKVVASIFGAERRLDVPSA